MTRKSLIMVSPHNWYDHVLQNKINRPLKLVEQYYNKKYFDNILIVNRIHPKRLYKSTKEKRNLIVKNLFYKVLYDGDNQVYYLEHCLPFGMAEKSFLPSLIDKVKGDLEFDNIVLLISDPKSTYLFNKFEATNVFDAYDDWSLSPLFEKNKRHMKYIVSGYEYAKSNADLIITNTEQMKKKMNNGKNKIYILSNASSLEYEDDISDIKASNIIGYIGNIHERIDLEILEKLLQTFRDKEFIFVGKNEFHSEKFNTLLNKYQNIKLVGAVPYKMVPSYIKKFDVCIVPHKVNEYTLSQDSMKIYDYLTFGKPIVSTKIPPTERLSKYVYISESVEDFIKNVREALNENNQSLINERISFMKTNNWSSIAKQLFVFSQEVQND